VIQRRLVSASVKGALFALKHVKGFSSVDLASVLENHIEKLLELPGALRFFPSKAVELEKVLSLIRELHPIHGGAPLVRVGAEGDGGYLVPDDFDGVTACFSPGVSDIAEFELACAVRGLHVFLADASIGAPPVSHPRFSFIQKYVGAITHGNVISLEDWIADSLGDAPGDLILQMDIEGAEYTALLATPIERLRRFRTIIVEFHYLDHLFNANVFPIYNDVFRKLLSTHHCVHIHPNNYCNTISIDGVTMVQMAEFTFLRHDRVFDTTHRGDFPHPLDRDNTDKSHVDLPAAFYRSDAGAHQTPPAQY
jgi:hypothetical protein